MPRKKASASGSVIGGAALGLLALIASVPREVWLGLGALAALAVVVYLYTKLKDAPVQTPAPAAPERPPTTSRARARLTPGQEGPARKTAVRDDLPVVVSDAAAAVGPFRIPTAPAGFGRAKWVPAGESFTLAGLTIPGGLLYLGTSLPTPTGTNDPCLIDPSKSVATHGDFTERQMGYWPSYSEISATARRAYLNWLVSGRSDPAADIGYVFLFFYGLERRAILDAAKDDAAKADWTSIAAELRRLLDIYGRKSGSFMKYAGSLLDWVSLAEHPEKAYRKPIPAFPKNDELPLYVRVALGQAAVDKAPVPAQLALAWAKLDPAAYLRTPATRCGQEFDKLFVRKYQEVFGDGMVLPRNRTKLKLVHRPASAGFRGYDELSLTFGETPDVTVLTAPVKKLQELSRQRRRTWSPTVDSSVGAPRRDTPSRGYSTFRPLFGQRAPRRCCWRSRHVWAVAWSA